jgi:hypothetical protein
MKGKPEGGDMPLILKTRNTLQEAADWLTQETGDEWTPLHVLDAVANCKITAFVKANEDMGFISMIDNAPYPFETLAKKGSLYRLYPIWASRLLADNPYRMEDYKEEPGWFDIGVSWLSCDEQSELDYFAPDNKMPTHKYIGELYRPSSDPYRQRHKIFPTIAVDDVMVFESSLNKLIEQMTTKKTTHEYPRPISEDACIPPGFPPGDCQGETWGLLRRAITEYPAKFGNLPKSRHVPLAGIRRWIQGELMGKPVEPNKNDDFHPMAHTIGVLVAEHYGIKK